jgi:hypothetical protein
MKAFPLKIQAQKSVILSSAEFSFAALRLPTRVLAQKNKSTRFFVLNSICNKQRFHQPPSAHSKNETQVKFAKGGVQL